jgi:hypothetical protein
MGINTSSASKPNGLIECRSLSLVAFRSVFVGIATNRGDAAFVNSHDIDISQQ